MSATFLLHVVKGRDEIVIRCSGELDASTRGRLDLAVQTALEESPEALHLDCTRLFFIASAGVASLAETASACFERGIDFRLSVSPQIRRVLDLAGLWWLEDAYADEPSGRPVALDMTPTTRV